MSLDYETEARLRKRAEKRVKEQIGQRTGLIVHIVAYIAVNAMLLTTMGFEDSPLIFIMGGWGIGLVAHFISYYNEYGPGRERTQARIDAELEREMSRMGYGKRKNALADDAYYEDEYDPAYRIADDTQQRRS